MAARAEHEAAMRASLLSFTDWFAPSRMSCWFCASAFDTPEKALESEWDATFGIVILVGYLRPTHVLAIAEPRRIVDEHDRRVFAWTTGDPAADTAGYPAVLTPATNPDSVPLLRELKPFRPKRRRW
jgi:hypothetical protein